MTPKITAGPSWDDLLAMAVDRAEWTRSEAAEQRDADKRTAMCTGKSKHRTEREAHAEARRTSSYVNIYECQYCRHWHIGKG